MQANERERRHRWHLGRWGWLALALATLALLLTSALHLAGVQRVPVQEPPRTVERVVGAARDAVLGSRDRPAPQAAEPGVAWAFGGTLHWIATAFAFIAALLAVSNGLTGGLVWELVFGIATVSAGALALQSLVGMAIALVVITGLIGLLGQIGELFDGSSCCGG